MKPDHFQYADDENDSVKTLIQYRLPTLVVGLFMGLLLATLTSRFEEVLVKDVAVAYFIPVIVYLADAIGAQTQTIYVRDLRNQRANFHIYLLKESLLGLIMGLIFGAAAFILIILWQGNFLLALAVSVSLLSTTACAPLVSLITTEIFWRRHTDPAATSGPIATVIQDTLSITLYGIIASAVLL